MKLWKAIIWGAIIGGVAYLGLIFLTTSLNSTESGKIYADVIAYAPDHLCIWLSKVFLGPNSSDAGMIFIFPAWISIGVFTGAIIGAVVTGIIKIRKHTEQGVAGYRRQSAPQPER